MGYPTVTRLALALAPAHAVLERRGNDATLLMLTPKEPREVARGKPRRGECLLLTSGRAERHTILAILGQSRAHADLGPGKDEAQRDRRRMVCERNGGYRPPASCRRSHPEKSRWPPDAPRAPHTRAFPLSELPNLTECPLARGSDRAGRSTLAAGTHLALLSGLRPAQQVHPCLPGLRTRPPGPPLAPSALRASIVWWL
jgi:hypothetical protein